MHSRPAVTVVTVNYNHGAYLGAYIESLERSRYPIAEIIIVDNGSADESVEILARYPHVRTIANPSNRGYSAALNQAIAAAGTDLVCATGPDVRVDPGWLAPLVDQYLHDPRDTFAVAARVLSIDGREMQSAGGSLHYSGHLCVYEMWTPAAQARPDGGSAREVGAIDSTAVLFDRAKYLAIGGCDTDFFVYHEEFDYCYRARMHGWRCWYQPASLVYHGDGSREYSVRGAGEYPRLRPFLHTRNRWLSILKNYQARTIVAIAPALLVLELLNMLMLARMGLAGSYWQAAGWIATNAKAIILKRSVIQARRRIGDAQLLSADDLTITPLLLHSAWLRTLKALLDGGLRIYWLAAGAVLRRFDREERCHTRH